MARKKNSTDYQLGNSWYTDKLTHCFMTEKYRWKNVSKCGTMRYQTGLSAGNGLDKTPIAQIKSKRIFRLYEKNNDPCCVYFNGFPSAKKTPCGSSVIQLWPTRK
jgi:hypothetical protein